MLARAAAAAAKRGPGLSRAVLSRTAAPALQRSFASATFLDEADVTDRVLGCVKSFEKVDPTKVTAKAHFLNDLGLDSLDTVEVVMAFEDEFVIEIQDADAEKIQTCEDAIKYIMLHPAAK
jgi:NADH dehydrogenase (ubiquinone) 1 alpha/beta subcomplex 1